MKRSPSIVFLPPLPPQAAQILRAHNEDTLQVFTTYVRTFVDQHVKEDDRKLPLTGINAGGADDNVTFPGSLPPTKVRSAFVALSGHGDKFQSISDLCRTTRSGVFLEEAVIPHLDVYPDESKTPLNAYLYDFFMHGDLDALEKANGVRKSDVWFLLNGKNPPCNILTSIYTLRLTRIHRLLPRVGYNLRVTRQLPQTPRV